MLYYWLILFGLINLKFEDINISQKVLTNYFILFTLFYLASSRTSNAVDGDNSGRTYWDGFITAHQMSYLMALFARYFVSQKKYLYVFVCILFVIISGARTGFLLLGISLLAGQTFSLNSVLRIFFRILLIFILIILVTYIFPGGIISEKVFFYIESLANIISVSDFTSTESVQVTA